MIEPIASKLLNEFFAYCLKGPPDRYVYRISPQEVLSNVLKYGTSRKGFFTQEWDRSDLYPEVIKKYGKLQHADIIIASTYEDLLADAKLEQGTFMHKLSIYENPIICVYDKSKLEYLCDEIKNGPQNTGKN